MKALFILMTLLATAISCPSSTKETTKTEIMEDQDVLNLVKKNDIPGVSKALKNGVDANTVGSGNRSLLLIATVNGDVEMAKLLVQYKADVNQQADNQDSPFLYAGASGQIELVKLFLENGARFDIFNRYHGSALIPACERGHVETVRLLANIKNYPINHINRLGWTALMEAIILGDGSTKYQQIVHILKDAGAKLDIPDNDGKTPLQHAKDRGFQDIVTILKS